MLVDWNVSNLKFLLTWKLSNLNVNWISQPFKGPEVKDPGIEGAWNPVGRICCFSWVALCFLVPNAWITSGFFIWENFFGSWLSVGSCWLLTSSSGLVGVLEMWMKNTCEKKQTISGQPREHSVTGGSRWLYDTGFLGYHRVNIGHNQKTTVISVTIGNHQLLSATFLPSGTHSVPVDILTTRCWVCCRLPIALGSRCQHRHQLYRIVIVSVLTVYNFCNYRGSQA